MKSKLDRTSWKLPSWENTKFYLSSGFRLRSPLLNSSSQNKNQLDFCLWGLAWFEVKQYGFKEFSPPQHIRNNNPDPQCSTVICLIAATMERKTAQYNHPINLVYSIAQIFSFVNTFSLFCGIWSISMTWKDWVLAFRVSRHQQQ